MKARAVVGEGNRPGIGCKYAIDSTCLLARRDSHLIASAQCCASTWDQFRAVSSSTCNGRMMAPVRRDFQGRGHGQAFSGARVEARGDGVRRAPRVARQVRALRQVLAQQSVRVLIGAALPGAVRIGEDDLAGKPLGQRLVFSPLFPAIIIRVFRRRAGTCRSFLVKPWRARGICPVHRGQEHQAGGPRHQGAHRRAIASALDPVAFPVAGHRAGRDLGRTLIYRRPVGNLAASIGSSRPRAAGRAPDAAPPTVRCARLREATPSAPHRSSLPRAVCACRQDTRVGGVRHSVRARSLESDASAQTATTRDPGVCGVAVADRRWRRLDLRRTGAIGAASRRVAGRLAAHGAGGASNTLAIVRSEWPWVRPRLRSHALQHSRVSSSVLAWQHPSP